MRKSISLLLSFLMVICIIISAPVTVSAADVDDLTFELNEDDLSYSVTNCDTSAEGELVIPATYNGLPVTDIGYESFLCCEKLTSIIIPDGVTNIGNNAFNSCEKLESIVIPDSVKSIEHAAFSHCTNLSSIAFPDSITMIPDSCFSGCSSLCSFTISDRVMSIGYEAFAYCTSLTSVTIPDSVTSIGEGAFAYCTNLSSIAFPDSITMIPDSCFSGCSSLCSFTISDRVMSIGAYAFYGCTSLGSITIPDSVTSIGNYAFRSCDKFSSITIPDSVTSIGIWAFADCESLVAIEVDPENSMYISIKGVLFNNEKTELMQYPIGNTATTYMISDIVTNISDGAFYNCKALSSITVPDSVTSIGRSAFTGTAYYNNSSNWDDDVLYIGNHLIDTKDSISGSYKIKEGTKTIAGSAFQSCTSLTSVTIPDGVKNIGDYTFFDCENLTSIIIPNCLTYIGDKAFAYCENLSSITIPDSVTSIGNYAFYGCRSLTSIEIPNSVTSIGDYAFCGCLGLKSVEISDSVTSIGENAFTYCRGLTSISIPNRVKYIGDYAFNGCEYLTSVTIGKSVYSIGSRAYWGCERLTSVKIPCNVKEIGDKAFGYRYGETGGLIKTTNFTIYGKKGSVAETYVKENDFRFIAFCEHETTKWITDKEATVYKAGSKHKECTECGEELKTATIKQLKCAKPVLKKVYNANSYVKVTWGTVKGADLYRVYRKTGTGDYEYIGSTKNKYFNDKNAPAGKTCRYRIRAKNEAGYSEYSASIAIKHIDEPTLKSIENSAYGILIKWGKVTGAEKYNVYRMVSGGEYKYIGATSNTYYTDKTAKSGTKYYYAIRAKRDDSISSQSASLSKYYLADPALNTPTSTTKGVGLRWSKVAGAEGYKVYRRTASGSYKRITTEKGVDNLTYRDTTAKKGTKYYYKVKAYKSKTYSAYSNTKAITDKY